MCNHFRQTSEDRVQTINVIDYESDYPQATPDGFHALFLSVGTFVAQVHAMDADEPGTAHVAIAYSVVKQEPEDGKIHFRADKATGKIYVQSEIDREVLSLSLSMRIQHSTIILQMISVLL